MNKNFFALVFAVLTFAAAFQLGSLSGSTNSDSWMDYDRPQPGASVRVQLRRDALGGAADLPVPPMTSNINGAVVSLDGIVRVCNDNWVCIQIKNRDHWISRHAVLLVEITER